VILSSPNPLKDVFKDCHTSLKEKPFFIETVFRDCCKKAAKGQGVGGWWLVVGGW
jgi:hypothetical protein